MTFVVRSLRFRFDVVKPIGVALLALVGLVACGDDGKPKGPYQRPDLSYVATVDSPTWPAGEGPVLAIDEAHNNFNRMGLRYRAFAELLSSDGYQVRPMTERFSAASLKGIDILVISNALHDSDRRDWSLPNTSAFTEDEITAIEDWVSDGGSLWLMADHQPWAGAAADLASRLGLQFMNGYALLRGEDKGRFTFSLENRGLRDHPVVQGRKQEEFIPSVHGFTGQAFTFLPGREGRALMVLMGPFDLFMPPSGKGPMTKQTPRVPVSGFLQGATLTLGRGRVAVFGEAGMFSAQIMGDSPKGFNHPKAPHNAQFTLNVAQWLSGLLED